MRAQHPSPPRRPGIKPGPDPVDIHVGKRLRVRRMLLNLTQDQLASEVGVAFQQIQKYERGVNRISASRLYDIARALSVDVTYFYEDMDDGTMAARPGANPSAKLQGRVEAGPMHERDLQSRTASLQLLNAYWALADDHLRDRVLDLVESMRKGP